MKEYKTGDKCPCNQELPWHLVELNIQGYGHVCTCGREYKLVDASTLLKLCPEGIGQ